MMGKGERKEGRKEGRAGSPFACQKEETQCSGTMERSVRVRGGDLLVVGESEQNGRKKNMGLDLGEPAAAIGKWELSVGKEMP